MYIDSCIKSVTGIFPPPPRKVPGFAKYAVDAKLFRLESTILLRAKRATNRNNIATENVGGGNFPEGVYLEPLNHCAYIYILHITFITVTMHNLHNVILFPIILSFKIFLYT